MLCKTCQLVFKSTDGKRWSSVPRNGGRHHETMAELLDAVTISGCGLCSLLVNTLLSETQTLVDLRGSISNEWQGRGLLKCSWDMYTRDSFSPSNYPILRFSSPDSRLDQREFALIPLKTSEIMEKNEAPTFCPENGQASHLSHGFSNLGAIRSSSNWLQKCLEEHQNCQKLQNCPMPHRRTESIADLPKSDTPTVSLQHSPAWFPKRLVEIDLDNEELRIIETSETVPKGPYATLSHCWGKHPNHLVLTTENLFSMKERIPAESLASTFTDAVTVSRCLGIQYLWIDSLCILQHGEGSTEDWEEHTVAMRDVYSYCIVNISADRAASSGDGFLGPYSLDLISPVNVHHPESSFHRVVDLDLAQICLGNSPLSKRAWVLQERWLSPRILHFTAQQVFWECRTTLLACEAFPSRVFVATDCDAYEISSPQETIQWSPSLAPFNMDWIARKDRHGWYQIFEEYTARKLSFPNKDKFHALAGVVNRIQQEWPDDYIAGLFRSDLPIALLYGIPPEVDATFETAPHDEYRAPTWSWASLDRPISYSMAKECLTGREKKNHAEIIEAASSLAVRNNPLGPVREARLLIQGHLCNVRWKLDDYILGKGMLQLFPKDGPTLSSPIGDIEGILDHPSIHQNSGLSMIALLIAESTSKAGNFMSAGLLLILEPGKDGDLYSRIGLWTTSSVDNTSIIREQKPIRLTII